MNYMDKKEQQSLNIVRILHENPVIGVEFVRIVTTIGYDEAVKILEKAAKHARSKDFV